MDFEFSGTSFVYSAVAIGAIYSLYQLYLVSKVDVISASDEASTFRSRSVGMETFPLVSPVTGVRLRTPQEETECLIQVSDAIACGANSFLVSQYTICLQFVFVAFFVILILVSWGQSLFEGTLTAVAFLVGSLTSIACGWGGMRMAVFANVRATVSAMKVRKYQPHLTQFGG